MASGKGTAGLQAEFGELSCLDVSLNTCIRVTITDEFSDGICCTYGNGIRFLFFFNLDFIFQN